MSAQTPMMRQWSQIKRQYPDCIVMFRLGDFYEAFNADAERVASVCDVVLTSRPVKKGERAPMAGVPYHAVDSYIAQLVRAGCKVAIVEQLGEDSSPEKRARMSRVPAPAPDPSTAERPRGGRAILEREVVRVVTPGTLVEGDLLDARAPNHLVALLLRGERIGLAHADVTTGSFRTTELAGASVDRQLIDELLRLRPAELIHPDREADAPRLAALRETLDQLGLPTLLVPFAAWRFDPDNARRALLEHFGTASLAAYGCEGLPLACAAAGAVLGYVSETQRAAARQLRSLSSYALGEHMQLDAATRRNLELTHSLRGDRRKGTLLAVLDQTRSPMGARCLRGWLEQPLLDRQRIEQRLEAVELLLARSALREALRAQLGSLGDLERQTNRVLTGYAGPRELLRLAAGLRGLPALSARLVAELDSEAEDAPSGGMERLAALCRQPLLSLAEHIEAAIDPEAPTVLGQPGVVRRGYSRELDAIHDSVAEARSWIAALEGVERQRSGIKGLKVGYNRVFGYYLQVPRSAAASVPEDYHRKQTLSTGERYVTPELKAREAEVLEAEERIVALERELVARLIEDVVAAAPEILAAAAEAGMLDALVGLAETASRGRYTRPTLDDSRSLEIRGGRHPVVERARPDEPFVPNDLAIGEGEIVLLTGPNMAGKSTVGRQVALICLMAQIGSFVPAEAARIGLVDRIFTRIGAQDEIAAGQSTFMVEMVETAGILNHASPRSLIVLDELGRGTSTYDGMSIAWAVIEQIHNHPELGARTLFATHYHELTALEALLPRLRNLHLAVAESEGRLAFLHELRPGPADRSYGIHVAELAGLPRAVTRRAWAILERLEREGALPLQLATERPAEGPGAQLSLFAPAPSAREHPLVARLRELDVDQISPLEALTLLYELRRESMSD
ncbi:MAG: DNA mismatch repair protein MutS [Chloroflexi bacterium]|nr:DNA mismatch repair protein MutS [Chloroflexota bacterium]